MLTLYFLEGPQSVCSFFLLWSRSFVLKIQILGWFMRVRFVYMEKSLGCNSVWQPDFDFDEQINGQGTKSLCSWVRLSWQPQGYNAVKFYDGLLWGLLSQTNLFNCLVPVGSLSSLPFLEGLHLLLSVFPTVQIHGMAKALQNCNVFISFNNQHYT